jgi:hypothetical protein
MAETETLKCPSCGYANDSTARHCTSPGGCRTYLKSELECLRSIDDALSAVLVKIHNETSESNSSLETIKHIAIWFLIMSILGLALGFLAATGEFR